jgi:hypothetical protein
VDLLGYVWEEGRDKKHPYRKGTLETQGRNAQAVLLGWLSASLIVKKVLLLPQPTCILL